MHNFLLLLATAFLTVSCPFFVVATETQTQNTPTNKMKVYSADFEDTQETTLVWTLISTNNNDQLHQFFIEHPTSITMRSADGRGALWYRHKSHILFYFYFLVFGFIFFFIRFSHFRKSNKKIYAVWVQIFCVK